MSTDCHKIGDKIKVARKENRIVYSFEYFPPKTEQGILNLFDRLDRMACLKPEWIDVTWGAGGSTSKATLDICTTAQQIIGLETMMHLTCTNMPVSEFEGALVQCKESGIRNILALRGDPPRGQEWKAIEGGFANAVDLVRFIREKHGDYFGIVVAGYPEKHQDAESYEVDLKHLKEKVDAGADAIITQLFYDNSLFLKFVDDCRALGITVPIIPGIMPIQSYGGFKRMTELCQTHVPKRILDALEPIKDDDAAVKAYGVSLAIEMCRELIENGIHCLHMYSLNQQASVQRILEGLGLVEKNLAARTMPWRTSSAGGRDKEAVRPIFWSNRTKSYQARTKDWDDFPNGRWGDVASPTWGDLTSYHVMGSVRQTREKVLKNWGEPANEEELCRVFAGYVKGEVAGLPWVDSPLALESGRIRDTLVSLNERGFMTINSQPAVAGVPSTDAVFGWGPKGGTVFQKAYVEFFVSPVKFAKLKQVLVTKDHVSWMAVSRDGDLESNYPETSATCAVTFGVFPAREVLQPTIVDKTAFMVWREEAFGLWTQAWGSFYEEGAPSRQLIDKICSTYYLVNMVDNDFMNSSSDIFSLFNGL